MKAFLKLSLMLGFIVGIAVLLTPSPKAKARQTTGGASQNNWLAIAALNAVGGQPFDGADTSDLNSIFGSVVGAANSVPPGPNAGAQRRAIDNQLRASLENFLTNYPGSAWGPAVHILLARRAQMRCGYSLAMDHFRAAFDNAAGVADPSAGPERLGPCRFGT